MSGVLKLGSTTFGTENNGKIELTNVANTSFSSSHHTWELKAVDAPIVGANYSTNDDPLSGQLAIYNGATKLWGITEGGWVQNPNVPGFRVRGNSTVTVDATGTHKIQFDLTTGNECYTDGNWDTTTNRYTAPVSGKYWFGLNLRVDGGSSYFRWQIVKNDAGTFHTDGLHAINGDGISTNYQTMTPSGTFDLSAGDFISVYVTSNSDTSWDYLPYESNFCGFLIG